ncbi:MAG: hypothetical protein AAFQ79_11975 [Pseudomonadota bacterium]
MDVIEQLDALRGAHRAVEAAAYVDFKSGTVLASSAVIAPPQERLDALCETAGHLLDGPAGQAVQATMLSPAEAIVIQRADDTAGEALCLICAANADLADLGAAAKRLVTEIGGR